MSMNREGYVVVNFALGALCLFGINGKCLRVVTHSDGIQVKAAASWRLHLNTEHVVHVLCRLQCLVMSRDGQYLMTGGDRGVVAVWRAHDLHVLYTYPVCDSGIRSLALSHDQR